MNKSYLAYKLGFHIGTAVTMQVDVNEEEIKKSLVQKIAQEKEIVSSLLCDLGINLDINVFDAIEKRIKNGS